MTYTKVGDLPDYGVWPSARIAKTSILVPTPYHKVGADFRLLWAGMVGCHGHYFYIDEAMVMNLDFDSAAL